MMRRPIVACVSALLVACGLCPVILAQEKAQQQRTTTAKRPPNVVFILADDIGYGDLGCYGGFDNVTPILDSVARQGMRLTDFYVAQAVCSASRTAFLTGCYPNRVGIMGALGPISRAGLHKDETTLAELFKSKGYATAIYGKWHLGHEQPFLPMRHGFDEYFGLPYSNDMGPLHPTDKAYPPLPLIDGNRVVQLNPDQSMLTTWYTEHAVSFIEKNKDRPFFLYVPHTMPHVPLFVSDRNKGKSGHGLYADVVREIDWSAGEILQALDRHGLTDNTIFIFASDNGPWLSYGNHAGSTGGLREGKATTFEGGVRVPFLLRWPGHVPAGSVCREPVMSIDLLPTLAAWIGVKPPKNIDGLDVGPLLLGEPDTLSPHDAYYFYWNQELHAVRSGRWKLHLPHDYMSLQSAPGRDGRPSTYVTRHIDLSLFDLQTDPRERTNIAAEHPDAVKRLSALAERIRRRLGDSATGQTGSSVRPAGSL